MSAALIAFVEARNESAAIKNELCAPVSMGDSTADYVAVIVSNMINQQRHSQDLSLRAWLRRSRLDGFLGLMSSVDSNDIAKLAILQRIRATGPAAFINLSELMKFAVFQMSAKRPISDEDFRLNGGLLLSSDNEAVDGRL